jgi:hypothetical protein
MGIASLHPSYGLRRGLLSDQQVKNAQFLLVCLLILIVCSVPPYFKRNIKRYSMQHPPPSALKKLWPPQIRGMIAIGVLLFIAPVIVANFVNWGAPIDILAPKRSMFIALLLLSGGIYFAAEGSACGALYTFFTSSIGGRTTEQDHARSKRVGWVEPFETHQPSVGIDGYRFALPILRA